jgi:hypothetical protein
MCAAAKGYTDCVRLLIDAGADKEAVDEVRRRLLLCYRTFLFHFPSAAAFCSSSSMCLVLSVSEAPICCSSLCFSHVFCIGVPLLLPSLRKIKLENFLFPSSCDDAEWGGGKSDSQFGRTALICAAAHGHAACARLLIDAGADKEAKNDVRFGRCFDGAPFSLKKCN